MAKHCEQELMDSFVLTSLDEFTTKRKISEVVTYLQPGDIVKGLKSINEYYKMVKLIDSTFECTVYGNDLTMCILGKKTI
jgi:hypothetical protein